MVNFTLPGEKLLEILASDDISLLYEESDSLRKTRSLPWGGFDLTQPTGQTEPPSPLSCHMTLQMGLNGILLSHLLLGKVPFMLPDSYNERTQLSSPLGPPHAKEIPEI